MIMPFVDKPKLNKIEISSNGVQLGARLGKVVAWANAYLAKHVLSVARVAAQVAVNAATKVIARETA